MSAPSNPFLATADFDIADADLALAAASGSKPALDQLIGHHHQWIYNLALRFMLNPDDAADLSQDAMVRIITRIGHFEGRSSFRTWAYRIVLHCFMDAKRGRLEKAISSFEDYGMELDALPLQPFHPSADTVPERALIIEEAKNGCMLGMLLCLSREQRLIYILGAIFESPSIVAAEILDISATAFRKQLQRARTDLHAFMNDKCGLINKANPCRCDKKTKAFIDAGWVDPENIKFADSALRRIKAHAPDAARQLDYLTEDRYADLYKGHPVYERSDLASRLEKLLHDKNTQAVFKLND
ncbi:MAG: RNA polymerase sigma factor [Granulosicoccus sp.]